MKKILPILIVLFLFKWSSKAQSPCAGLNLNVVVTNASCANSSNGSITVTPLAGMPVYSYQWSANAGGASGSTASNLTVGSYSVIVNDGSGCADTAYANVISHPLVTPDICMASVDDSSVYNVIYYDKTAYANVDSFIFYRETSAGVYTRIGARPYDSLSRFFDTVRTVGPVNGDPNLSNNRYKIQILDSCGNYSALSPYHNTLYVLNLQNGSFQWNLPYEIEGQTNVVNTYSLLCDTANNGGWGPVSTVSGTSNNASDPGYATHSTIANWRVATGWSIVCNPTLRQNGVVETQMAVIKSRSNVMNNRTSGIPSKVLSNLYKLYPNPSQGEINLETSGLPLEMKMVWRNVMGESVKELNIAKGSLITKVDIRDLAPGIYLVEIKSGIGTATKRVVVGE